MQFGGYLQNIFLREVISMADHRTSLVLMLVSFGALLLVTKVEACFWSGYKTRVECPRIISRSEWGARAPRSIAYMPSTPRYVFIHHSDMQSCSSESDCKAQVRAIQNFHMDTRKWDDIGYSFLVGEDGNVYEGRGWKRVGAHTLHYNTVGIGICAMGDFQTTMPTQKLLSTFQALIACAHDRGYITETYDLLGHRDVGVTSCPGQYLYDIIQKWPHYNNHIDLED